jgi:tetratricopeptide (TPR) repeat protein
MTSLPLLALALSVLVWGSGCQPAVLASADMQQKFFSSLKNANPEEEPAVRCANYYNLVGRVDLALNELNRAIAVYPNSVRLLNAIGGCYDRLGNYAKAREMYERALAQDADNNLIRNNLGYSSYLSGDLKGAEKIFQDILAQNPDYTLARNNLGLVWCRQGKEKEALSFWQKTEGDIPAREKLHQVLAYLGKPAESPPISVSEDKGKPQNTPVALQNGSEKQPSNQDQLTEITRLPKALANSCSSPVLAEDPGPMPVKSSQVARKTATASPELPVKIAEVAMVVQPASYSPPPAGISPAAQTDTIILEALQAKAPDAAPSQTRQLLAPASINGAALLPDGPEPPRQPRYYRRPQWQRLKKPRIITCSPQEPQKNQNPMKTYLNQEAIPPPQSASGKQETTIY